MQIPTKNKTNILSSPGEKSTTAPLSVMNIPAAINELRLPEDVTMGLVYSGLFRADLTSNQPTIAADDVIELAARIEHFRSRFHEDKREADTQLSATPYLNNNLTFR